MTVTEKKCSVCGIKKDVSEFYTDPRTKNGLKSGCKVCLRASELRYYHSEVGKEKQKVYDKAYRLANKERTKLVIAEYYQKNRAKLLANRKAHDKSHTEERKIYFKNYRQAHQEQSRLHSRKRKALKRGNTHKPYADNYVFQRDGWICQLCGRKINKRLKWPNPLSKSIDHIVPISKGGSDAPANVQATHLRCNLGKHATNKGQLRLFG